jgi:hypothetical protein
VVLSIADTVDASVVGGEATAARQQQGGLLGGEDRGQQREVGRRVPDGHDAGECQRDEDGHRTNRTNPAKSTCRHGVWGARPGSWASGHLHCVQRYQKPGQQALCSE